MPPSHTYKMRIGSCVFRPLVEEYVAQTSTQYHAEHAVEQQVIKVAWSPGRAACAQATEQAADETD